MPARDLPSAVALSPPLRRATRRTSVATRLLLDALVAAFPDALALARDPTLAERFDTTPYDHVADDAITAACSLLAAIDALDQPEPAFAAPDPAAQDDDTDF